MKIFILVVDENRGFTVDKERIEEGLKEASVPECSFHLKELGEMELVKSIYDR